MIIIAFIASALTLWLGYQWGFQRGQTEIEHKIVKHVTQSPQYARQIEESIRKSFKEVKDGTNN